MQGYLYLASQWSDGFYTHKNQVLEAVRPGYRLSWGDEYNEEVISKWNPHPPQINQILLAGRDYRKKFGRF